MKYVCKKTNEKDTEEADEENATIESQFSNVYYYGNVTTESVLELTVLLKKMEKKLISMKNDFSLTKLPNIFLYIQSNGGDALAGLSAMDTIKSSKVPIITIVNGYAASAATFMLLGGKERWMQKSSYVLIHQISTQFWGKFQDLRDETTNCERLMQTLEKIYKESTKLKQKEISKIISKEIYLNSNECLEKGIVDKIV